MTTRQEVASSCGLRRRREVGGRVGGSAHEALYAGVQEYSKESQ